MKSRIQQVSRVNDVWHKLKVALLAASSTVVLLASPSAMAEDNAPAATQSASRTLEEVVVTARKKDETSISVPITITAVGAAELDRRAISGLDALAKTVPGLTLQEQGGTIQGGTVSMRGITGPNTNALGDQAVSFNMDGVAIARSTVRRLGAFDLDQVEVLKGPQALFFGKNSPGGVISMRTADPTKSFDSKVSIGYEGKAREVRAEAFVAGPLTENWGGRFALYTSSMKGFVDNTYPAGFPLSPKDDRGPKDNEIDVRGTLKYDNGGPFSARLKVSAGSKHGSGIAYNMQPIHCGTGNQLAFAALIVPGGQGDCVGNGSTAHADLGHNLTPYDSRDSGEHARQKQQLVGLEMNYDVTDALKLTSVTGYYHAAVEAADHYTYNLDIALVSAAQNYNDREISQEIRLASSFDGPLNFMVGGLYSSTKTDIAVHSLFGSPPPDITPLLGFPLPSPTAFNQYEFDQKGTAYSFFGQVAWKIAPTVELSVGGRYSHEEKRLEKALASFFGSDPHRGVGLNDFASTVPKLKTDDFSPEITASWRPQQNLNLYLSFKRGFLSGGYNGSSDIFAPIPGQKATYDEQKIRGFEGGVKAKLLNDSLRVNLSGYAYDVTGLQVAGFEQGVSSIRNAGKVRVTGAEGDFSWATPVAGLDWRGAAAYNRARYKIYTAPCYGGQTQELGCTLFSANNPPLPDKQDLAGTPVPNAPEFVLTSGINYETGIGSGFTLGLSADVNYSDGYVTDSKNSPFSSMKAQTFLDASVRLGGQNDRWQVALVGRNLTNKYYWTDSQDYFPSGSGTGGPPGTASVLTDRFGTISRGRELWVKLSAKFN